MQIEVLSGLANVAAEEWNALVGDGSPFLEWGWLASLEEARCVAAETGWLPQHLVLRDGGRLVGACPLYVKGHSQGEFVFDHGWAEAAARGGIAYYPKLLVATPFTPATGVRFLAHPEWNDRGESNPQLRQRWDVVARLKPGTTLASAQAGVNSIEERLKSELPEFHKATSSNGSTPAGGRSTTTSMPFAASGGTKSGASAASSRRRASPSRRSAPTRSRHRSWSPCFASTCTPSTSSTGGGST